MTAVTDWTAERERTEGVLDQARTFIRQEGGGQASTYLATVDQLYSRALERVGRPYPFMSDEERATAARTAIEDLRTEAGRASLPSDVVRRFLNLLGTSAQNGVSTYRVGLTVTLPSEDAAQGLQAWVAGTAMREVERQVANYGGSVTEPITVVRQDA